jgi:hypothetical protein
MKRMNKAIAVTAKYILVPKSFLVVLVPLYITNQNKVQSCQADGFDGRGLAKLSRITHKYSQPILHFCPGVRGCNVMATLSLFL